MKLSGDRFSVPSCILDDGLPDKAVLLLIFLFRQSDIAGCAAPSYDEIQRGAGITSRNTVANCLKTLRKHGWFHFVKKGGGKRAVYWLRIPPRFTETDAKHDYMKVRLLPKQ